MNNAIYVRHALTNYSIENLFAGRKDIPIIDIDLSMINDSFDLVTRLKPTILVHSPLIRAKQTADLFIDKFKFSQIYSESLLIERDFGNLEGKKKTSKNREILEFNSSVESNIVFENRVKNFIDKYKNKDDVILIVGHSAFYRKLALLHSIEIKKTLNCCESIEFKL